MFSDKFGRTITRGNILSYMIGKKFNVGIVMGFTPKGLTMWNFEVDNDVNVITLKDRKENLCNMEVNKKIGTNEYGDVYEVIELDRISKSLILHKDSLPEKAQDLYEDTLKYMFR